MNDEASRYVEPELPEGLHVEMTDPPDGPYRTAAAERRLRIVRRWRPGLHVGMLAFGLVLCGFVATTVVAGVDDVMRGEGSVLKLLLMVPFLGIGAWMLYPQLACLVNVSELGVENGEIRVHHRTLPWRGNATYPARSLEQLEVVWKDKGKLGDEPIYTWSVRARFRDRPMLDLVDHLPTEEHARFLETCIERHLGIVDDD